MDRPLTIGQVRGKWNQGSEKKKKKFQGYKFGISWKGNASILRIYNFYTFTLS